MHVAAGSKIRESFHADVSQYNTALNETSFLGQDATKTQSVPRIDCRSARCGDCGSSDDIHAGQYSWKQELRAEPNGLKNMSK